MQSVKQRSDSALRSSVVTSVPAGSFPGDRHRGGLSSDVFVRFAFGLLIVVSLPYFVPILDKDQLWYYGSFFLDLPLLILIQVVLSINFLQAGEKQERQFWGWLIFGFALWFVQSIAGIALNGRSDLLTVADLLLFLP